MAGHTERTEAPRSGHPIEAFLCSVLDDLKALADVPAWSMDDATATRGVQLAARVAAGVAEVEARSIHQAVVLDLPGAAQCRSTGGRVRQTARVTARTARTKTRLAASLPGLEPTRTATARAQIHAEQAQAIADQVARLDGEKVSAQLASRANQPVKPGKRVVTVRCSTAPVRRAAWSGREGELSCTVVRRSLPVGCGRGRGSADLGLSAPVGSRGVTETRKRRLRPTGYRFCGCGVRRRSAGGSCAGTTSRPPRPCVPWKAG
jgi:hypothetical protein